MFADDLVLLSESSEGLQKSINNLSDYCAKWDLTVNLQKTKIIIFNKAGKQLKNFHFSFRSEVIELVSSYTYLGIVFNSCGSFSQAVDRLVEQANKALYKLKQKNVQNNVVTALKLFDTLILPILRYCSEIWAPLSASKLSPTNFLRLCENVGIEKLQTKFCRYLLGVQILQTLRSEPS